MVRRIARTLAAVALLAAGAALSGCVAPGPLNNRLVLSEWKAYRAENNHFGKDWRYQGEHWERLVLEAYENDTTP
ncbi:MAG: hypothetical protein D6776_11335 [Planctomycetota bacterium]|nr:MAG: hypothetical protein D6776_11335 [Planctomycetota bacterium]